MVFIAMSWQRWTMLDTWRGLRRVSASDAIFRMDIAEVVWHVINRISIFRGGFGFGRSSFDWTNGARSSWQNRRPSARSVGCDSLRARNRQPDALCGVRLSGMGCLFVFFRSVVQIARSTVVACNRRLHRFRHADQVQHAGLSRCDRYSRAIYGPARRFAKQIVMACCRGLGPCLFAQPDLANAKPFRVARFSPPHS
jgi:hypothetical protein